MFWPEPTHQPTHPSTHLPNYTPIHGWGSLHRFQIFKQNWNISISSSAIEFWLIPGVPPWGVGGGEGVLPTHMHAHTCMHTHAYDIIGNSQGFPKNPMEAAICMKLSCLPCACVHACVRTCACMCVHVHMCGGHPHHPPSPSTQPPTIPHPHPPSPPPPEPQGVKNTKIQ